MKYKKVVYEEDINSKLETCIIKFKDIIEKLSDDALLNQGLFLMMTSYFEGTLRDIMVIILTANIDKLDKDSITIPKDILADANNKSLITSIISHHLYNLFKGNVKNQLIYATYLMANISKNNIKKSKNSDLYDAIVKCSDISIYRNCLIHNNGDKSTDFDDKVEKYKASSKNLNYSKERIELYINDHIDLLNLYIEKVKANINYIHKTKVIQLKLLWEYCFDSPLLKFEDYWSIDEDKDLITDIKRPRHENNISSGEKVYLSIWRHQFYDLIPAEQFLLCSIDTHKVCTIYRVLDELKFYHMYQKARDY